MIHKEEMNSLVLLLYKSEHFSNFWTNFLNLFRNRRNVKIDKMTEKCLFVEELMK